MKKDISTNSGLPWISKVVPQKILITLLFLATFSITSCSDFVEVNPPKNNLIAESVFEDPATVESALANIYFNLRQQGMVSGRNGLTTLMGTYADELDYYGFNRDQMELYQHTVNPNNTSILAWWNDAYNGIYASNDAIKGIRRSSGLTTEEKNTYIGQALFIRAYLHGLLASLFGDIPYITTTDYLENGQVNREPYATVMGKIGEDLEEALTSLSDGSMENNNVLVGEDTIKALLARTQLALGQWEKASSMASELIDTYPLESDLNRVFLKGSPETIWQLKSGDVPKNTLEANELIIRSIPGQKFALTPGLIGAFEAGDGRLTAWIGSTTSADGSTTLNYAHKYKADFLETESLEHSIVFRVAEQYLIRAEARVMLGNLMGARQDLDTIRERAGLGNTKSDTKDELLDAILRERRVEFFCENGLRWFDLKRTGMAPGQLSPIKPNWKETDILLPIPEKELETNPNLSPQNPGY